jgi:glycosyltransferase involved in cell wall biosynthesis
VTPASPLLINGRFLTQGMTGVQRFATEITRAADALAGEGLWPAATRVLVPPGAAAPGYRHLAVRECGGTGRGGGQAWEQIDLPRAARGSAGGMLLNLGNTAPVLLGWRQAVVIHDAGVFDTPESYSLAFRAWYRLLHRALARRGAMLLTVSDFSRGRIAHHLRLDPARIGVVHEGGEHILREAADAAVLARHGLAPGRFALVVGTQAAHKNLAALEEAAGLLAGRGMALAIADGCTTGAGVRMLGRVSDAELRALYEAALCLVFPSRYEGFGLPPIEALCCGCPVVAARSGAVPEVCGEAAALWFDADGPRRPAQAIARLIEEPGLRGGLVAAGRARAARFSWRAAALRLLELVRPGGAAASPSPAPEMASACP